MDDAAFDSNPDTLRHQADGCWIVCESSNRWARAVRRFSAEILAPHPPLAVVTARVAQVKSLLTASGPKVVLWEVRGDQLVSACDGLIQVAAFAPECLQLIACQGVSGRQRIALAELPVAGFVQYPEDLPRLRPVLQGYFARHRQLLD